MAIPIMTLRNNTVFDDKGKKIGVITSATPEITKQPSYKFVVDGKETKIEQPPIHMLHISILFNPVELQKTDERSDTGDSLQRKIKL
jgi:hypothetical protein